MSIAGLIAGLALLFPHPAPRVDLGAGWILTISRNDFAAETICMLRNRDAHYVRRAVVFRFRRNTPTSAAVYRVDEAAPVHASEDLSVIAQRGFALAMHDLQNPSGGVVRIPVERLSNAQTVRIDPDAKGRPVAFPVAGLQSALDNARTRGCDDAAFR